jgi:hypothetical protein
MSRLRPATWSWRHFDRATAEVVHGVDIAAGASIAGTTIGIIETSPVWPGSVPGNQVGGSFWQVGSVVQGIVRGTTTTGATPGTLTIDVRLDTTGGTLLCTSGALTLLASQTTSSWELYVDIICRSTGTSGTVMAMGRWTAGTALLAAGSALLPATAPAVATMDTTTNHSFVVCVTESNAGTSCIVQQSIWVARN